jgi:hypothetical protein
MTSPDVFDETGALRGVYLSNPSGKKPLSLQVRAARPDWAFALNTTISVDGSDFFVAWAVAVERLANYWSVRGGTPLFQEMVGSWPAFLKKNGLRLTEVTYHQVERAE